MYIESAAVGPHRTQATPGNLIEIAADLELPGFVMSFDPNEEIFGEEEPADFVYKVISGTVRTTRLLSDGRRQIGAFHLSVSRS